MIVSKARKYVFVAQPRTASRAIAKWLLSTCDGLKAVATPQFGNNGHHRLAVPPECKSYHKFCVIRQPAERLESYFRSSYFRAKTADCERYQKDFLEWLHAFVEKKDSLDECTWHGSQKSWAKLAEVDTAVLYEELPLCLEKLPFIREGESSTIGHIGGKNPKRWPISEECHAFCRDHFAEDYDFYESVKHAS